MKLNTFLIMAAATTVLGKACVPGLEYCGWDLQHIGMWTYITVHPLTNRRKLV